MRPFAVFAGASKDSIALKIYHIQLLESPIPPAPARPSQKASSGDISGTKRGIIDPPVSKRTGKTSEEENLKKKKNGQKLSKLVKLVKMVKNGPKWSQMIQSGPK